MLQTLVEFLEPVEEAFAMLSPGTRPTLHLVLRTYDYLRNVHCPEFVKRGTLEKVFADLFVRALDVKILRMLTDEHYIAYIC